MRLRSRVPFWGWGLIGVGLLAVLTYLLFGGRAGLDGEPFKLELVFRSDAQLTTNAPVRIAGIDVGKVTSIEPLGGGAGAALVTTEIEPDGLPIHRDATAKIRTRLILEGNFSIELSPGSPSAPVLPSGSTIDMAHTTGPVQFDRLLTDLQLDARLSLRTLLQGLGRAYGTAGEPRPDEDPETTGLSGGQALNRSLVDAPAALLGLTRTNQALLGLSPDDLAKLIRDQARIAAAFASRERQLSEVIVGFNRTLLAFASQQGSLRRALSVLPSVLRSAGPTFDALDASLPDTRAFARAMRPSIRELPATIDASLPWIAQVRGLVSKTELGRLAELSRPATEASARSLAATRGVLTQLDLFNGCMLDVLEPVARVVVEDPPLTTGVPVFREFLQTFVGVLSATQNFDGNGLYGRAQAGGGNFPVTTSDLPGQGPLRGNATRKPLGTRPAYPDKEPPLRYDVACQDNKVPDINAAKTGAAP